MWRRKQSTNGKEPTKHASELDLSLAAMVDLGMALEGTLSTTVTEADIRRAQEWLNAVKL